MVLVSALVELVLTLTAALGSSPRLDPHQVSLQSKGMEVCLAETHRHLPLTHMKCGGSLIFVCHHLQTSPSFGTIFWRANSFAGSMHSSVYEQQRRGSWSSDGEWQNFGFPYPFAGKTDQQTRNTSQKGSECLTSSMLWKCSDLSLRWGGSSGLNTKKQMFLWLLVRLEQLSSHQQGNWRFRSMKFCLTSQKICPYFPRCYLQVEITILHQEMSTGSRRVGKNLCLFVSGIDVVKNAVVLVCRPSGLQNTHNLFFPHRLSNWKSWRICKKTIHKCAGSNLILGDIYLM